jgi:Ankyrin repeats (3 copies)
MEYEDSSDDDYLAGKNYDLINAVEANDIERVSLMLSDTTLDPNYPIPGKAMPFTYSCSEGMLDMVRLFLDCPRTDVNTTAGDTIPPLIAACLKGHLEVVMMLMEDSRILPNITRRLAGQELTPLSSLMW